MFCGKCGTEVPEEFAFCTKCGMQVEPTPPMAEATPTPGQQSEPPVSTPEVPATDSRASPSLLRTLVPIVFVLAIIGGFMAVDRVQLHWYVPEDSSDSIESVEYGAESIEHELASIDAGELVAEDDPAIVRFGAMLNNLEWKCPDSRQHLADMGVTANGTLEDHGVSESLLDTFVSVNDLIADTYFEDKNAIGASCDWLFADYATAR